MSITANRRSATKIETATAEKMGPWQATALVVGSIVGVGIFSLPYSLAAYGPISLVAMAIASVGAIALAMAFAGLSRRLPASGGPYAYARTAFGNTWGFANAWSYWITAWAGNAAIAVAGSITSSTSSTRAGTPPASRCRTRSSSRRPRSSSTGPRTGCTP
jgi:amino acid transporter